MRGYLEIEERVVFGVGQALSRVVINYNEKGQRTEIYYGNNTKTKYEYDAETFRLTRLLTTRNAGADKLQDINYTYDPVGNITEVVDAAQQTHYFNNTATTASGIYTYDALYRLKTATGRELTSLQLPSNTDFVDNIALPNTAANAMQNYTQQFQYDELGNIEQMKSVGTWTRDYYYDFANNKNYLLGHTNGTTEYTYDKHGNTLSMPHLTSMIWDNKDQLKEVNLGGGGTAYYVYDSSGERVRKVIEKTGGIVEERIYLGGYEVYRKTISGTLDFERQTLHLSDGTKKIASIETKTVENGSSISSPVSNIRYQYDNHLGSASLELDENAAIISYEEYHPFGTTSYRSGRTETEVSLKRYKYVGKERDEETGLYYYGARYYAAWICRFISVDPLQFEYPQLTPYNYAGNKPITYIDIDGMQAEGDNPIKADNTNVVSQPINLDKFKPSTAANFLVSGVKQPEPYTIGAYNPTGMSDEFLHTRSDQIKGQNKFDELLYKHQERSPLMFGNPGQPHGAGLYSSLEKGAEIYGAIEGGAGLLKFGSFGLRLAKFGLKASIPQIAKGTLKGMGYTKRALDLGNKTMIRFPKPTRAISEGLGIFSKGPDILFLPGEKTILSEGIKLALFYFGNKNFIDSGIIETEKLLIDSSEKLKKGFLNVISNDKITNENLSVPLMPADNTRYVQKPFKSFIKK